MPNKGFFPSLFDISFTSLVTTKVIKFVYVITLVFITLTAVAIIFFAFHASTIAGVIVLFIGAPLYWFFYVIYSRITLEVVIALFRVMETNAELVMLKRQQMGLIAGASGTAIGGPRTEVRPTYQVGDVVNGHRFNGIEWVPVAES